MLRKNSFILQKQYEEDGRDLLTNLQTLPYIIIARYFKWSKVELENK